MGRTGLEARTRSIELGFNCLLSLIASGFIALFYLIAYRRFRYPDQLEWLEGGVLDAVRRVVHHQPVYVAPSSTFIPFIYTPGYYYVSALLCRFMGVTFAPLRLLSILATTGCLVLVFCFVRRNTKSSFCGLLSAGLFAALYAQTNAWFDLARVDMLALFFLLAGIFAAQQGLTVWAAVAFAVAFQTKQSAAGVAVFVLAHEFTRPRRVFRGWTLRDLGGDIFLVVESCEPGLVPLLHVLPSVASLVDES